MYNRTDGTPQDVFKKLGDAATEYVQTVDLHTLRNSCIPDRLAPDALHPVFGLSSAFIKTLCSTSVYKKAKRFEVKTSNLLCTQVDLQKNLITGSYKAVKIYDQRITWGNNTNHQVPFSPANLMIRCQCAFFKKKPAARVNCCKHVIGHLRRIIYISALPSQNVI